MLRGLLVLGDVHLALVVLVHQRDVVSAHQISRMQIQQRVVVGVGIGAIGVDSGVDENRVVTHRQSPFVWPNISCRDRTVLASLAHHPARVILWRFDQPHDYLRAVTTVIATMSERATSAPSAPSQSMPVDCRW